MKTKLLYIMTVLLSAYGLQAQMIYGPKIGVNTSRLANDNIMPGFHVGGFVNAELRDRIGLQVDFLWALKGNKNILESTSTGTSTSKVEITTTTYYRFIEVPLTFYFPISQHIRGFVGPQLNLYRKGHQTVEYPGTSKESNVSGNGKASIIAGFDFVFDSKVTFGLRFVSNKFTTGASASPDGDGSTEPEATRLNSIMATIGYKMDW